jgi:hypothetical protein
MAKPKREIWHPAPYEKPDVVAMQALLRYAEAAVVPPQPGEQLIPPSPEQVKRALDWIVNIASATYDEPFLPGQEDVRNYMLGRRSVGLAIVKLMKLNIGKVFSGKDDYSENG